MEKNYDKLDIVEMRKPHACQTNRWQIIRMENNKLALILSHKLK